MVDFQCLSFTDVDQPTLLLELKCKKIESKDLPIMDPSKCSIVFLLDTSTSMFPNFELVKDAVLSCIQTLSRMGSYHMILILFSAKAKVAWDSTQQSLSHLTQLIHKIQLSAGTNYKQAL